MANKNYELMHNHIMLSTANLIVTVPFSKLTVKQICEAANINRNTFYRHFADKIVLLEVMLTAALTSLFEKVEVAEFKQHPFESIMKLEVEVLLAAFDFQLDDSVFQDIFDGMIFKTLRKLTDDQEFLWSLGNMYIIRLWNHNQAKPYSLHNGYQIFDQMFRDRQFPDSKK